MPRWGVSWGSRLFRVGQSPNGRWWGYFNFMGFRFFRYLDEGGNRRWGRTGGGSLSNSGQQGIPTSTHGQGLNKNSTAASTPPNQVDWAEIARQDTAASPLQKSNDAVIEAIQEELDNN